MKRRRKEEKKLTDVSPWAWWLILTKHHISHIFEEERKPGTFGFANGQNSMCSEQCWDLHTVVMMIQNMWRINRVGNRYSGYSKCCNMKCRKSIFLSFFFSSLKLSMSRNGNYSPMLAARYSVSPNYKQQKLKRSHWSENSAHSGGKHSRRCIIFIPNCKYELQMFRFIVECFDPL